MTTPAVRLDSEVVAVGAMADAFFAEGIIVLFGDDAPEELREVAVVHRPTVNVGGISPGDVVAISHQGEDTTFTVLGVGDVANDNMVNLGHLVLKRNGSSDPAMPGDVCCTEGPLPELGAGATLTVAAPEEAADDAG